MEPELKIALKNLYSSRRAFLRSGIIVGTAAITGLSSATAAEPEKKEEEEVGPPEDLMREHGVLKRVLLVYGEVLRRMDAKQDFRLRRWLTLQESFAVSWKIITRSVRRVFFFRASKKPINSWTW